MSDSKPGIYVIGDSISIQYGPFLEAALDGHVRYARKAGEEEALLDLDNPRGANGGDSAMVRRYLDALAINGGFTTGLLLLNCGLHDIKTDADTGAHAVEIDQYRDNLHAIVDRATDLAEQLVWMRTTPVDDELHARRKNIHRVNADVVAYNAAADHVMRDRGVEMIDLYTFSLEMGPTKQTLRDGVHYHEPYQQQQGEYLAAWVLRWAATRGGRILA